MDKVRGFEIVREDARQHPQRVIPLPARSTKHSAGYDFTALETHTIHVGEKHHFVCDVKAYMQEDEVLLLDVRSSMGFKRDLQLANTIGVVDSDYYSNIDNDGNIGICLRNIGNKPVTIQEGEKIAQGIFTKFLIADDDDVNTVRTGGIGSTGR